MGSFAANNGEGQGGGRGPLGLNNCPNKDGAAPPHTLEFMVHKKVKQTELISNVSCYGY